MRVPQDMVVQPEKLRKRLPAAGAAVRVTEPPFATGAVQPGWPAALQSMPPPLTLPAPVPEKETVSG